MSHRNCRGWSDIFNVATDCRVCFVDRNPATRRKGPRYDHTAPAPPPVIELPITRGPCVHLVPGSLSSLTPEGKHSACSLEQTWECEKHERCTRGRKYPGTQCCAGCGDYAAEVLPLPTVAITSWQRPDQLTRLLAALAKHMPGLPVEVEDTGGNLSAGRNRLYARVETPTLVMMEEDFVPRSNTLAGIMQAQRILEADPSIAGVGGIAHEPRRGAVRWGHDYDRRGDRCYAVASRRAMRRVGSIQYRPCDLVLNWGVFRASLFAAVKWDEDLPIDEHWDFYWRASRAGYQFAFLQSLQIDHLRDRPNAIYNTSRARNFKSVVRRKLGFAFTTGRPH